MKQSAQGSAGTWIPEVLTGTPRVPPQPGAQDVDRERAVASGATRGEHTHSEQPIPGPRPVQRASVRGQILDALRTALVTSQLTPGEVYSAPALGSGSGSPRRRSGRRCSSSPWRAPSRSCPIAGSG